VRRCWIILWIIIWCVWLVTANRRYCRKGETESWDYSKPFRLSTRRTRVFMGIIISTMLLRGTNCKFHGQPFGLLTKFYKYETFCATLSSISCSNVYKYIYMRARACAGWCCEFSPGVCDWLVLYIYIYTRACCPQSPGICNWLALHMYMHAYIHIYTCWHASEHTYKHTYS